MPVPWRRSLFLAGGVVAALGLFYGGDLALAAGSVPRGVTVAGVPLGGLDRAAAEQTLRRELGPRLTAPVPVTFGTPPRSGTPGHATPVRATLDPAAAGLAVDWAATLDRAGAQPLDPGTRLRSFFGPRDTGVIGTVDTAALDAALTALASISDSPAVEGGVRFDGAVPRAVDPVAGHRLDVAAAAAEITRDWTSGRPVALPLASVVPKTTADGVRAAIEQVARPAVSAPVTVATGAGPPATLTPEVIAGALTFVPDPTAGLVPRLNTAALAAALTPQLAATERPARDATLDLSSGLPVVVPSQDGRVVDYAATLGQLIPVLTGPGPRQVAAVYTDRPAELTTEKLTALRLEGVIGDFTTGGFAADSGLNIRRAAERIDGTIVAAGATFSLNAATNPRDAAHGYVEAGIIEDGHPSRGIGGGVSQVATTLYNAAYFAGMTDVEHREHSFFISRYPPGREATVFDDVIDLRFRNDNPGLVIISTTWTPASLTVRILGTKRYDVTSTPGPRTEPTAPTTVTLPVGQPCSPSKGAPGFTITNTRTLTDVVTGRARTESRRVRYHPSPIVVCAK